jgi:hypothetical protein
MLTLAAIRCLQEKENTKMSGIVQNREEAEAIVRAIERTCRGPYVLKEEVRKEIWKRFQDSTDDLSAAIDIKKNLEQLVKLNGPAGDVGLSILSLLDTRSGCGADFNQYIIANKFDGKNHLVTCTKCGLEHEYQAPWFEGLTEHLD